MLILITHPHLSLADKSLLSATIKQSTLVAVVCTGDGVYAPMLNHALFEALLTSTTGNIELCALKDDMVTRGANSVQGIKPISNQDFAVLSSAHQQWVTL